MILLSLSNPHPFGGGVSVVEMVCGESLESLLGVVDDEVEDLGNAMQGGDDEDQALDVE
jgi:hypothetical protein